MDELPDFGPSGLLEAARDAVLCVTTGGRIAMVNARAERLFGYPRADLLGRPVGQVLTGDRGWHDLPLDPAGAPLWLAARRQDGSGFTAEAFLAAIGTPAGTLVSAAIRDVDGFP